MSLKFRCRACGAEIIVKYLKVGEQAKCKACGVIVEVPRAAQETDEESTTTTLVEEREKGIEEVKEKKKNKTHYQKYVENYQTGKKHIAINKPLYIILFLVVVITTVLFGLIGGLILCGLMGLILLLVAKRKIVCPSCGKEFELSKSTKKYICENCYSLLLLGSDKKKCELSECPYCKHKTYVAPSHGVFLCSNCGMKRDSTNLDELVNDSKCPECKKEIPEGVLFCKYCDKTIDISQTFKNTTLFDFDWVMGKDAYGHFKFAQFLMMIMKNKLKKVEDHADMLFLLQAIEFTNASIQEILQNPQMHTKVLTLLYDMDTVYAKILEKEIAVIQSLDLSKSPLQGPHTITVRTGDYENARLFWHYLKEEPHITTHWLIEEVLHGKLEDSKRISKWNNNLVYIVEEKGGLMKIMFLQLLKEHEKFNDREGTRGV
jgi:DNA-directed RNA polymerase subunit RPC12/RpoP